MKKKVYYSRLRGILQPEKFEDFTLACFGLGSGGAPTVFQLLGFGAKNFILVDPDTLDEENIVRHPLGYSSLGLPKVEGMRRAMLDRNPESNIETYQKNLLEPEFQPILRDIMRRADIVLMMADDEGACFRVDELAMRSEKHPVVAYAGCHHRAMSGMVAYTWSPKTACYGCLSLFLNIDPSREHEATVDYSATSMHERVKTQGWSGLGLDINFVSLLHARIVLEFMLLLTGQESDSRELLEHNLYIWGNHPCNLIGQNNETVARFEHPLELRRFTIPKNPDCAICRGTGKIPENDEKIVLETVGEGEW